MRGLESEKLLMASASGDWAVDTQYAGTYATIRSSNDGRLSSYVICDLMGFVNVKTGAKKIVCFRSDDGSVFKNYNVSTLDIKTLMNKPTGIWYCPNGPLVYGRDDLTYGAFYGAAQPQPNETYPLEYKDINGAIRTSSYAGSISNGPVVAYCSVSDGGLIFQGTRIYKGRYDFE